MVAFENEPDSVARIYKQKIQNSESTKLTRLDLCYPFFNLLEAKGSLGTSIVLIGIDME
jgi:hypothetical protein